MVPENSKKNKTGSQTLNPEKSNLELMEKQRNTIRRKLIPKMAENVSSYSVLEELLNTFPKINFVQLIKASPELRNQLVDLCRKVEKKEVNQIENKLTSITNFKAIASVFRDYSWAVIDTGAVCSVVNPSLLKKWVISPDTVSNQVVVIADGSRHETGGKVTSVPINVAGYTFPVGLVVMDRKDDFLVLGTDWFLNHGAIIDMKQQELLLPAEGSDVIISLSTKNKKRVEEEETEL
ncbi:hypothetical protein AYI69_g7037 [Smittium culicis]|uniref:DNA damage-inducible protein 1 n=1 Tax=Smittium culicis TaxID=133412 RepID=A0A1R1XUT6_9FUNG|nr:hypothetical protein AYI69_g7037 [Smittium culicis]